MYSLLETTLSARLDLLCRIRSVFISLHPELPSRLRRGETQNQILEKIHVPSTGFNKRVVTEALQSIGYKKVKTRGILYYRKMGEAACFTSKISA